MESTANNNNNTQASFNVRMGLIIDVLKSGHSVELPTTGYSMFPVLKPGDTVIVNHVPEGELPQPGSIVIFEDNGMLVMHRLIEIHFGGSEKISFITRGDCRTEADSPWMRDNLIGATSEFRRNQREYTLRNYVPAGIRYCFNLGILWIYHKMNRLKEMQGLLKSKRE